MALKQIAKGLGWFSIGLGPSQLLFARQVGKATGVGDPRLAMNAIGLRELGTGALILGAASIVGAITMLDLMTAMQMNPD